MLHGDVARRTTNTMTAVAEMRACTLLKVHAARNCRGNKFKVLLPVTVAQEHRGAGQPGSASKHPGAGAGQTAPAPAAPVAGQLHVLHDHDGIFQAAGPTRWKHAHTFRGGVLTSPGAPAPPTITPERKWRYHRVAVHLR